jgi:hypothetical protein
MSPWIPGPALSRHPGMTGGLTLDIAMPHPADILPEPYRPPTREHIERARTMYGEGFTVARILAACDMSLGTLYYWLSGGPREAGGPLYPPLPRRRQVVGKRRAPLAADGVSLMRRLMRTAERQVRDIEERLARPSAATPERERDVRMLSMLVRTLRDLGGFGGAAPDEAAVQPALEAARQRMAQREALRDVERRTGLIRDMVSYLREMRKIEVLQVKHSAAKAQAEQEKAKVAADTDEFRCQLARRIDSFAAAQREKEE